MNHWILHRTRHPRGITVTHANGTVLAQVRFPRYFSENAMIDLQGAALDVRKPKWWSDRFEVLSGGSAIATIQHRPGSLRITLIDAARGGHALDLRRRGFGTSRYELSVPDGPVLVRVVPQSIWSWLPDMTMTEVGAGLTPQQLPLALILTAFGIRLMRVRTAAAAA